MSQQQFQQQVAQWYELYRTDAADIASTRQGQNMKMNEMMDSKYLKQTDIDGEQMFTVESLKKVNVAREDEEADYRWTCKFREQTKGMVLNATNLKRMFKYLGEDSDDWPGQKIMVYVDHDIEYAGKVVGGLRVKGIGRPGGNKSGASDDDVNRKLRNAADDSEIPF